ncbi:protein takeout-like [Rhodnius prolixus]|uniref:Uncharacterized protein n=1 Tax=Rhodnius prolixus TaxID=13249 RepID=T1HP01_RHOPR
MFLLAVLCTWMVVAPEILAKDLPVYPLPPYVKRACARNDPNLNKCVVEVGSVALKTVIKGDPKYRVPVLNPMVIEELIVKQGTKQVGLTLVCKDCKLWGLENTKIVKADMNFNTNHHKMDFTLSKMRVVGKYNVSGQILLLPISGAGDAEFKFENLKFSIIYDTAYEKKSNGRTYLKVVNGSFPMDAGNLVIRLDNLFNGDKLLGGNMNRFLNENWKEILKDVQPALSESLSELSERILNNISALIPMDILFPKK